MSPFAPDGRDHPFGPSAGADPTEAVPDSHADVPDEAALAALEARVERHLVALGITDAYRDTLRGEVGRFTPEAVRASFNNLRAQVWGRFDAASAGSVGSATVKKLFRAWPQRRLVPHAFWRAAGFGGALGAVILLTVVGSWLLTRGSVGQRFAAMTAAAPSHDIVTGRGERTTLDLPDGTRIVLAPESRLHIPAGYANGSSRAARDVTLDGEAYFEVRHDAARPFRVRTANGIAEDLGTEFVVTAYPETGGMRVLVASGEVAIRGDTRPSAVLHAGDLAQLDTHGMVSVRPNVDARAQMAWTSGRLVFVETPLRDALAVLNRWYDVEFRLSDPALATLPLTATFERTSAQNIVQVVALLLHARAERHERIVTFFPRPRETETDTSRISPFGGTSNR